MTEKDRREFETILISLAEIYDTQLTETRLNLYFAALKDLTLEQVKQAANTIARTSRFFPKPADFLEAGGGGGEDKALQALLQVEKAIREIGSYRSVVFDDPVIHAVIETFEGGWEGICMMPLEDWKFARKDFIKTYKALSNIPNLNAPPKLIGRIEHENSMKGYHHKSQETVYIGDKNKAIAWSGQVSEKKGLTHIKELAKEA